MLNNEWLSAEEAAKKLGLSVGYVRELCNIGMYDKENGIVANKVGKSWRILPNEITRKLGIESNSLDYKKDMYIKELEAKIVYYETQFNIVKNLIGTIDNVVGGEVYGKI